MNDSDLENGSCSIVMVCGAGVVLFSLICLIVSIF